MEVPDTFFHLFPWVVANNLGQWGDALVLCDLEQMGLVGEDGHMVP